MLRRAGRGRRGGRRRRGCLGCAAGGLLVFYSFISCLFLLGEVVVVVFKGRLARRDRGRNPGRER